MRCWVRSSFRCSGRIEGNLVCSADDPREASGNGMTFGSCAYGAGFSMSRSTSFGENAPFDPLNSSLIFLAGPVALTLDAIFSGPTLGGGLAPRFSARAYRLRAARLPILN